MKSDISARQVASYIFTYVKPFPVSMVVLVVVAFISAADVSVRPYFIKIILDRLAESTPESLYSLLIMPVIGYIGMTVAFGTSHRVFDYFVEISMIPQMRAAIVRDAAALLAEKSHSFYQNNLAGSSGSKVNDLATSVPYLIESSLYKLLLQFIAVLMAVLTLAQVSTFFALAMLVWALLFIVGSLFFIRWGVRGADEWSSACAITTGKLVDMVSNMMSVRLFAAKEQEKQMLEPSLQHCIQAEKKMAWTHCILWACYGYSFCLLQAFNFYVLYKGRVNGWITVGDFGLVMAINTGIASSIWRIAEEFTQLSKHYGRITQALRTLFEPSEIIDAVGAKPLIASRGEVTFREVQFYYKGTEPLFQRKSVVIGAGQKVGLVGYSGGGKSTFVNLILRLYDVTSGRILIDGQDIRDVTQESLHRAIAMIPQDPSLFHRTVMDNIRYGRPEATDEEVMIAARKAHAHHFISALPQGYASLVGERGIKLSGGQRQRIVIARAILKNAPILILDEATSQLDSVTEKGIQDSLWECMQGKTTLVIAHRLSTLLHMDRILVFDQGKIIEDGTHAELVRDNGLYKTLWNAQVGGFLPDEHDRGK